MVCCCLLEFAGFLGLGSFESALGVGETHLAHFVFEGVSFDHVFAVFGFVIADGLVLEFSVFSDLSEKDLILLVGLLQRRVVFIDEFEFVLDLFLGDFGKDFALSVLHSLEFLFFNEFLILTELDFALSALFLTLPLKFFDDRIVRIHVHALQLDFSVFLS